MAYTKDKNLINYKGRSYQFTLNLTDGSFTTNHPNGINFIKQISCRGDCDLAKLVNIIVYADRHINPYIETIMVAAPKLWEVISRSNAMFIKQINELITIAQQNWKSVLKLENSTDLYPYSCGAFSNGCCDAIKMIKLTSLNLNELESKWYIVYENIPFVKKFAGQLEMYNDLLNFKCVDLIQWYNKNNIDITPYLVNKNILQVLSTLESDKNNIENKKLADGLIATYEKYKSLEGIDADGWSYKILNTHEQFKQEAEKMHNCLINCHYDEKTASGRCVIVVATTPDGMRIDVELKPRCYNQTMRIAQAYYKYDYCLSKEHMNHLMKWADGLHF